MASNRETLVQDVLNWLEKHPNILKSDYPKQEPIKELEQILENAGISNWELGPHSEPDEADRFLAVSPIGVDTESAKSFRKALLEITAPEGWILLPFKPRKQWNQRIVRWKGHEIDASDWQFQLYEYDDGLFEVVLVTPLPESIPASSYDFILATVLDSELGEEVVTKKIYKWCVEEPADAPIHDIGDLVHVIRL